MTVQASRGGDAAVLADKVRKLAFLAYHATKDPAFRDRHADELSGQLVSLEAQVADRPESELALWVGSIRHALGLT